MLLCARGGGGEAPLDVHGGASGSWPFGQRQHKHIGASGDTSSGADAGHAGAPGRRERGTHPPGDRLACENELPLMCGKRMRLLLQFQL